MKIIKPMLITGMLENNCMWVQPPSSSYR